MAEWLQQNFFPMIESTWATSPERDVGQAFVQADEILLQPKVGRQLFGKRAANNESMSDAIAERFICRVGWLFWVIRRAGGWRIEVRRNMCTCTGD